MGSFSTRQGDQSPMIDGVAVTATAAELNTTAVAAADAIADLTAITGGESPTEAEHNALRTAVNAILAALRARGIVASA